MEKLPIEIKTKWVEALRSGKYKQGRGRLYCKKDDSFCCLGVLGDVCNVNRDRLAAGAWLYDDLIEGLPDTLYGCSSSQMALNLAEMNDAKKSFVEIADYIERTL